MKFPGKLNQEERELLAEFLRHEGWGALLKVVDALCADQDNSVLKYSLSDGPEGLVIAKARTEGARTLQRDISQVKERFLNKQES
jgi:hypothetical protein